MANFRNRYDPLRLFFKRIGTLALALFVITAAVGVYQVYVKERESRVLRTQAETQRADLTEQAKRLQEETTQLQSDRGKEALLREQYDVGKAGEGLIVIVDPPTPKPIEATSTFMQKVKKFFLFW